MPRPLPHFLPTDCPTSPILDLSQTLSTQSTHALEQVASTVTFKPVVVILPSDYVCPDARQLTIDLAGAWHIDGEGKNLLLVVDLKGHNVRAHGSPELNQAGVTSSYMTNTLIAKQFIPYMKHGDLTSAIRLTLLDIEHVQSRSTTEAAVTEQKIEQSPAVNTEIAQPSAPTTPSPVVQISLTSILTVVGIMALTIVATKYFKLRRVATDNRKNIASLNSRLDNLYQQADQLGQAAEFLDPSDNMALSHEIADFFAKLTTMQNAQQQVQELSKKSITSQATLSSIIKLEKYLNVVEPTAYSLLKKVNGITGAVASYEAKGEIVPNALEKTPPAAPSSSIKIPAASRTVVYRKPSWTSEPIYIRPTSSDGLSAIDSYFATTNYGSNNPMGHTPVFLRDDHLPKSHPSGSSLGGGSWNSSHSNQSSSSSSSDGGGSWDSSSSDSSSSDSGSSSDGGGSW